MKYILIVFFLVNTVTALAQTRSLDAYISSGILNSPLLKDYKNQAESNAIDSLRINASYKPQVVATSSNTYAPTYKGYGYESAITNGGNFSQLISVTKRLVSKENLQNQYQLINLQNQTLQVLGKVTEQDIKRAIGTQYITAYGTWQQYLFNKEVLDVLKKEDTILRKLTEKNVYRQTDYLTFLITEQQQQLTISQIKIQFQNELATLNYLSGIRDTSFTTLATPKLEPLDLPNIEQTVFYEQYTIDSLKLKNNDALIEFNYKPKVNLYADAGHVSTFELDPYKNFGTSFGINISVPIYDGKQKKLQHDKNAIAQKTISNYQTYFKSQYQQQIAQLMQQLQATEQLITETTTQIKYIETLIDANRKLLATGDARIPDYILAITNYITTKNSITQNNINKLQIINQLNYWNRKK
jgi:outer membrane protein TolC